MSISLRRLIKKQEIYVIISKLSNEAFLVEDFDGKVLYDQTENGTGEAGSLPLKYPIELEGQVFGWIRGGEKAAEIARLLIYFVRAEQEKKALGQETLAKYREITLLYDITEKLAASLNPSEVASLVIKEAKKLIKSDNISLMLIDDETGLLEVMVGSGQESTQKIKLKPGKGFAGSILETGKAEILNDVTKDSRYVPGHKKISSMMCAPLKIKDRVIGVINISSEEQVNYTAEDLKLLSALTLQAAAAIENARLYDGLKETFLTAVYTLAETIEKRDPYTGGHTKRVMEYSVAIGKALNLLDEEMERLRLAAVLHDVGKIGVRDEVLLKNGKLDDVEFDEIKKHTVYGEEVLKYIRNFKDIIPGVKHHHERYDGKGYPEGLRGEDIDKIARIIAVGDTFDAMTTDRPYRKALSKKIAFEEIRRNSGSQFDPAVVEGFFKAMKL